MRGRVSLIKVHASDSSAMLLKLWTTLIFFALSISCGGEFHLLRFTHLILWLCYLDFGLLCRSHSSCLQYLMQERVLPTKVYTSDSLAWTLEYAAVLILFAFSISCGKECLLITACAFDPYQCQFVILLRPNALFYPGQIAFYCRFSFFVPLVFYTGESFTYQGLQISFFGFAIWTLEYSAVLAFNFSCWREYLFIASCAFNLAGTMWGKVLKVLCIWSGSYHHAESILSRKIFHFISRLSYPGQLCYFHWLSHILSVSQVKNISPGEYLIQKLLIYYPDRFPHLNQLLYLSR